MQQHERARRALPWGRSIIETQSDLWLNTVLRSIGDAVIACDGNGHVMFMNGVAEHLTGWTQQQAEGLPLQRIFHIVHEATREQVESPVDKVRRLGTIVGLANHTLLLRRDGSEIAIDDSGAPIFDQHGKLTGIVLTFREITERRRAERNLELLAGSGAALAASLDVAATLRHIAQLCTGTFCDFCYFDLIGPDGTLQRTTRLHRDPAKQALLERASRSNPTAKDQAHPVMQVLASHRPLLMKTVTQEWLAAAALNPEHHAAIRELKFHTLISIPLMSGSTQLGTLSFCRATQPHAFDDEDLQVADELGRRVATAIMNARLYRTLADREESLRLSLQAGKTGIWELHPPSGKLMWSPRVREIFGLSPEAPIDIERNFELIHPDDREATSRVMQAALDPGGDGEYSAEFRVVRPTGEVRWVSARGRAFFENSGVDDQRMGAKIATRFVGMVIDVTEARQAAETIRVSEMRFRTMIENASVGILIGDLGGALTYVNPALLQLLGYTSADVTNGRLRWDQLTPAAYADRDRKALQQLRDIGTCEPYEKAYLHADGHQVPVMLGATMLGVAADSGTSTNSEVAVFVTDLTGLRQTESALRETDKLAAVGRLAGSIAHEINNPLEAVTNLLYLLGNQVTEQPLQQLVATAQEELARVSHIVTHTLRFHRQATRPTVTRISTILESVLALYRGRLRNLDISVDTRYRQAEPLLCYEGEIRQVLANLVGNALDASPRGGHLLLRERAGTDWTTGLDGVVVTVADTGQGMDRETLSKAFKAFFTTKGIGGTGLGLWISEEIMQKHGGHLKVRSRTGKGHTTGTVFMMFLPYQKE